jgi:hypothetical protein
VAQTLDQQTVALEAAGVSQIFADTMSGARDDRPGLAALLDYVREGDTVVVWKLDRLGRNTLHILETVKALTDRGVTLISTTDGIDSSKALGRMMIGVLGALAEYERELVKERTALKRQASRANGTRFGRPKRVTDDAHIATGQTHEGRRAQRKGHRQIPWGQPRHSLPVPGRGREGCIAPAGGTHSTLPPTGVNLMPHTGACLVPQITGSRSTIAKLTELTERSRKETPP